MKRQSPEGNIPLIEIEGSVEECGRYLAYVWRAELKSLSSQQKVYEQSWNSAENIKLFEKYAPHIPELMKTMAKYAKIDEKFITPKQKEIFGCTSFALHPSITLDAQPISGQSKDTPLDRIYRYQVLKLKVQGAPSLLTLTYPGLLFGHGFVKGGCSIFRNSLSTGYPTNGKLDYDTWGILAHHCQSIEDVKRLSSDYGINQEFHTTIADEKGGILGIESGKAGLAFLKANNGIYVHTNHVISKSELKTYERSPEIGMANSIYRYEAMHRLLNASRGHLSVQLAYAAFCNGENYPDSLCSDQREDGTMTSAAVICEPTKGKMHICRGMPNQNWPVTYEL